MAFETSDLPLHLFNVKFKRNTIDFILYPLN